MSGPESSDRQAHAPRIRWLSTHQQIRKPMLEHSPPNHSNVGRRLLSWPGCEFVPTANGPTRPSLPENTAESTAEQKGADRSMFMNCRLRRRWSLRSAMHCSPSGSPAHVLSFVWKASAGRRLRHSHRTERYAQPKDVGTTIVCTHRLRRGGLGVGWASSCVVRRRDWRAIENFDKIQADEWRLHNCLQ